MKLKSFELFARLLGAALLTLSLRDGLKAGDIDRALVFTRTKHGADRVVRDLERDGFEAAVIHGNKSQNARQNALNGFRNGTVRILVATDIAARGIDVPGISHVVNFDLPDEAESYVHRVGRTGRNGADGTAITRDRVSKAIRGAQRAAGLQQSGVHILRHTFCSHLAMKGAPARAIQDVAGHADLTTTQRYMHLSPAATEDAIRLLDDRLPARRLATARGDILETGLPQPVSV